MKYQFPVIENFSDIKDIILDIPEINIIDKGDYKVIAYKFADPKLFPIVSNYRDSVIRECRGLIFDNKGKLLSRVYHKFFNINEREETFINNIDISQPHIILDKLDGSMISFITINDNIYPCTKRGVTDISKQTIPFLQKHQNYIEFYKICRDIHQITPIFEWCSPQNKIVIQYNNENLILTGMRYNDTGLYVGYDTMVILADYHKIPVVKAYPGTVENMEKFISTVQKEKNNEGYVIRFNDGHMLKCKNEWYTILHKTKDIIRFEKDIVNLILTESLDDLKPLILKEYLPKINEFENNFVEGILKTIDDIKTVCQDKLELPRKDFSTYVKENIDKNKHFLAFGLYDNKDIYELTKDVILKRTGSSSNLLQVKHLYNCNYDMKILTEDEE